MTGWSLAALALLGAYHGLNPAMGWLFAVALGFQAGRRRAVLAALPPIALGHALSIALSAALLAGASVALDPGRLRWVAAGALVLFGAWKLLTRAHPRWTGMRVGGRELVAWSFLVSTAHGAGLMLTPILLGRFTADHGHAHAAALVPAAASAVAGIAAIAVHTTCMFLVMGAIAVVVYDRLGVGFLRRAWLNTDAAWAIALVVAGVVTLLGS